MRHEVVALRDVGRPVQVGWVWMTLEEAERAHVRMDDREHSIGPLRRGVVYRSGYWHTVNTVHAVFVRVQNEGDALTDRRAMAYQVVEESSDDVRIRRHCTAWEYGRGNQALFMIEQ